MCMGSSGYYLSMSTLMEDGMGYWTIAVESLGCSKDFSFCDNLFSSDDLDTSMPLQEQQSDVTETLLDDDEKQVDEPDICTFIQGV